MAIVSAVVHLAAASVDQEDRVKSLMIKSVRPIRKDWHKPLFFGLFGSGFNRHVPCVRSSFWPVEEGCHGKDRN